MSKKSNLPAITLPPVRKGRSIQKTQYQPCGCELVGEAPLPAICPTHGAVPVASLPKDVLVAVVLDESGSMESCRMKTIEGYNEYIHGLQKSGLPYLVTLTKFDAAPNEPTCRVTYVNEPVAQVPALDQTTYTPRGSTPLYDALGTTIKAVEGRANGNPVLMVILTDGHENASHEYTLDVIKAMIQEKERQGNWTFVYLGANQDAWAVGQRMGFQAGNVQNYQAPQTYNVLRNVAMASNAYARCAMACLGSYTTATFFNDAGVDDVNVDQAAAAMGARGGKKRMADLTKEDRRELAKKAAAKRWTVLPLPK